MKQLVTATIILLMVCSCKKENQRGGSMSPIDAIKGKWSATTNLTDWLYDFQPPKYNINTLSGNRSYDMSINDTLLTMDNPDTMAPVIVRKYIVIDDTLKLTNVSTGHVSNYYRYKGL